MEEIILVAQPRTELGSRAARRIRGEGLLPANIYGQKQENLAVTVDAKQFAKLLDEGHRIVTIQIDDRAERSIVKEVQYDAFGSKLVHVDFTRIRMDEAIEVEVPVETVGIPKGVTAGGLLSFQMQDLTIAGLPGDVPEHFRLNIEGLELGQTIRIKDLTPPERCTFVDDPESVVIAVNVRREEVVAAPGEAAAVQPEVVGRKREEEEPPAEGKKGS